MQIVNANMQIIFMRKEILKFLDDAKRKSGLTFSGISRKAGIAPSTITRFIKSDDVKELSLNSLNKVAYACGYKTYENYVSYVKHGSRRIEISDTVKFETYEIARRLLRAKKRAISQTEVAEIAHEVINHAERLGTDFITDSLVMYVIEKRDNAIS